ncbi:MAG: hypothetical protein ACI4Q4_08275, partial [Oscillospiraceae bacterium]
PKSIPSKINISNAGSPNFPEILLKNIQHNMITEARISPVVNMFPPVYAEDSRQNSHNARRSLQKRRFG